MPRINCVLQLAVVRIPGFFDDSDRYAEVLQVLNCIGKLCQKINYHDENKISCCFCGEHR